MKEAPRPSKSHRFAENLTSKQRAALKSKAHHLNPIVQVGAQGLSETVLQEIQYGLEKHELIKIQLPGQTDAGEKKISSPSLRNPWQNTLLSLAELDEPSYCIWRNRQQKLNVR